MKQLREHPGIQSVYASNKDPYAKLKHPPHTLPFYSAPRFDSSHSSDDSDICNLAQYSQDVAKCNQPPRYPDEKVSPYVPLSVVR